MSLNRKPIILRIWPEVIGYIPGLIRIRDSRRAAKKIPNAIIDFSSVRRIDAVGATVLTLRLKRFLQGVIDMEMQMGVGSPISGELQRLGVVNRLETAIGSAQQLPLVPENDKPLNRASSIYWLEFSKFAERRDALAGFKEWLKQALEDSTATHRLHLNQLIVILVEIAKNSADHTEGDGVFGLELQKDRDDNLILTFAFGDMGIGIKRHIEANLPPNLIKRKDKLSLYEAYYYALKPGYTSRRNSHNNKGVGMSLITDGSKRISLNLSVFDAESRGLLSSLQKSTHKELRTIFQTVGHDVGFFYHGEIIAPKIKEQ